MFGIGSVQHSGRLGNLSELSNARDWSACHSREPTAGLPRERDGGGKVAGPRRRSGPARVRGMRPRLEASLQGLVRGLNASPRRRRWAGRAFGLYYRLRGAHPALVADAIGQAEGLHIAATRSTMRWAAALERGDPVPETFRPDRRLVTPDGRAEALRLLERRLEAVDDPVLRRHRSYLLSDRGLADPELREFVETSLDKRLAIAAVAAPAKRGFDTERSFALLCLLDDQLSAAGLEPFLVSGTLLGQVRHGRLLDQDYDIDVGLVPGDGDAALVGEILGSTAGLTVTVEDWRVWGTDHHGAAFDVFCHYAEGDRWYHSTPTHRWWNSPFHLVRAPLNGREFWVPDDTDTYLTENYRNWHRAVAFYDKNFDTPNLEYIANREALLYLYERTVESLERGDRFGCESAVRELANGFGIDLRSHFAASPLLANDPLPPTDAVSDTDGV